MPIGFRPRIISEKPAPRRRHLYEGSGKVLCDGIEPGTFVLYFRDDIEASAPPVPETDEVPVPEAAEAVEQPPKKKIPGKGIVNNRISDLLMSRLGDLGIETHLIKRLNSREQLVRAAEPLPFQIVMHNIAADYFAKRLGLEEGTYLPEPLPEFHLRTSETTDTVISDRHVISLGWASESEVEDILAAAQRINDYLSGQFLALGIRLVTISLEFGRAYLADFIDDTQIILIDEISPDTCHLLDVKTGLRLDKSRIKISEEGISDSAFYQEVAEKLGISLESSLVSINAPLVQV